MTPVPWSAAEFGILEFDYAVVVLSVKLLYL